MTTYYISYFENDLTLRTHEKNCDERKPNGSISFQAICRFQPLAKSKQEGSELTAPSGIVFQLTRGKISKYLNKKKSNEKME